MAKPRNPAEENTINGKTKTIIPVEKYPSVVFLSTALPEGNIHRGQWCDKFIQRIRA